MKLEYPKWLYHATLPACIVEGPDEHDALGAGWKESPADFEAPAADEAVTPRKAKRKP